MTTLFLCGAGNSEGVRLALTIHQQRSRWDRIVLLDDDSAKHGQSLLGVEIVGAFDLLEEVDPTAAEVANLVARTTQGREKARKRIASFGVPFASLVSPDVSTFGATLPQDIIVYQNATIGPEARIGEGSVVFMGGVVGHESRLEPCCVVASNAVINARVEMGRGVYLGPNATVIYEVAIGPWSTIGAGSAVIQDVPARATVVGVPGEVRSSTARPVPGRRSSSARSPQSGLRCSGSRASIRVRTSSTPAGRRCWPYRPVSGSSRRRCSSSPTRTSSGIRRYELWRATCVRSSRLRVPPARAWSAVESGESN
jgi:sugar O-acyltransferase (sialic acid O-acetyltransferase NeuD family)